METLGYGTGAVPGSDRSMKCAGAGKVERVRLLSVLTEQCLAPVPGGTGRYAREVAAALAAAPRPGWQVRTLVAFHRDISAAHIAGLDPPRRLPVGRRALTALWQRGLPPAPAGSVVHATTPLAPVGVRPRRGAVVVTIHDLVPYTHPDTLTSRGAAWHRRMIERAGRYADAIVVPTHVVAGELAALTGISRQVRVIGEGVTAACATPAPVAAVRAARRRFDLPERYLVAVGTLEPRKGFDTLIDALPEIEAGVDLVVIGPIGWGDQRLAEQARRRGVADRVRMLGRLDDPEMAAVVSGAAVSVTASRAEGFGLPVVEAMAMGVPVVHSDLPVLTEVSGGAGSAFPVGDPSALAAAVQQLLDRPDLAERAAQAGPAAAAGHSWSTVAAQLWGLYGQLGT